MGLRLEIDEGGGRKAIRIGSEAISIGRGAENTIVIQDPRSSRHHCRLVPTPQGLVLEDLESRNGTILNGTPVRKSLIKAGAQFLVGSTRFRVEEEGAAPVPQSPAAAAPGPSPGEAGTATDGEPELDLELELEEPEAAPGAPASRPTEVVAVPRPRGKGGDATRSSDPGNEAHGARRPAWIEIVSGERKGEKTPLAKAVTMLGRSRGCDIVVDDKRASGQHARIVVEGADHVLEDLQSTNGTALNGRAVERSVLKPGSLIQIGSARFRYQVAGAAPAREDEGGAGDEVVRFDLERFLERDRSQHPVAVGTLLVILAVIGYFAVDITRGLLREEILDPPLEGNLLAHNWSFEALAAEGKAPAPGWALADGDPGELLAVREQAQHPGRQALRVRATGDGLCRAVAGEDILLTPERAYRLEGFAAAQESFAAGLLVEWFRPAADGVVPMGRSFSDTARQSGEAVDIDQTVLAPANASIARVSCFVLGPGSAVFDRISLRAGAREAQPGTEAGGKKPAVEGQVRSWRGGSEDDPLVVALGSDGVFGVSRRRRSVLSLWAGLGPDEDPEGYGPRLAALRSNAADSSTFDSEVPDQRGRSWLTIEGKAVAVQKEVECHWRTAQEASETARAICLYLEPWDRAAPVVAQGTEGAPDAAGGPVEGLLIGEREDRVTLTFSTPLQRKAAGKTGSGGRAWTILEGPPGGFSVAITAGSRREAAGAEAVLALAEEAFRGQRSGEAIRLLESIAEKFPEEKAAQLRAQERLLEWKQAAAVELKSLEGEMEYFQATPASVVLELLVARLQGLESRYQGTPEAERAARLAAEARSFWSRRDESRAEEELARLLSLAKEAFGAGQLGLAEQYFRRLLEARPSSQAQREAENTLRLIESRRVRDRTILLQ